MTAPDTGAPAGADKPVPELRVIEFIGIANKSLAMGAVVLKGGCKWGGRINFTYPSSWLHVKCRDVDAVIATAQPDLYQDPRSPIDPVAAKRAIRRHFMPAAKVKRVRKPKPAPLPAVEEAAKGDPTC